MVRKDQPAKEASQERVSAQSLHVLRSGEDSEPPTSTGTELIHRLMPFTRLAESDGRTIDFSSDREVRRLLATRFDYHALTHVAHLSEKLTAALDPHCRQGRALRYTALRVMLEGVNESGLCFAVLGPHRGCGASFVAANLAVIYSELGLRTVLIDTDVMRPRQHQLFGCDQQPGLLDLVANRAPLEQAARPLYGFRGLSMVPAGRQPRRGAPPPIGGALADTIRHLRQFFDVIVCDAPPMGRREDCEVVAGVCGDAVTVLRKNHTPLRRARRLLAALESGGTNTIGCVMLRS